MGIQDIIKKLEEDTKKEIQKIEKETEVKLKEIEDDKTKIIQKIKEIEEDKIKKEIDAEEKRILALASLKARNIILSAKQEIIGQVYKDLKEKIKSLPLKDYQEIISEKIKDCCVSGEEEILIAPQEKEKITQGLIKQINEEFKKMAKKGNLEIKIDQNLVDGFIVRRGKIEIVNTWDNLIKFLKENTQTEVAKILFG